MLPGDVKVNGFDRHPFVESDHVRAFVVVGSSKEVSQELHHGRVQLRDVRHILQEEVVDSFIRKHELVELCYHLFQLIVSADLLEERWHFCQSKQYEFSVYCEKHLSPTNHHYLQQWFLYFNISMHTQLQFKPHFQETISEQETTLTNQLCRTLTHLNLQRVNNSQLNLIGDNQSPPRLSDRKDYLYVCVTGLPPINNEFQDIGIPGQILMVYPECFQPGTTGEQARQRFHLSHLEIQAANLHFRLKDRTDKPIVFVFHSFGSMIVSTFFRLYHHDYVKRVIGIIPIGAYPIRIQARFRRYILWTQSMSKQEMLQNANQLYELQKKAAKQANFYPCPNKYAFLGSLVAFGHGLGFDDMLVYLRRWFPVLKCFIYGRQDNRIPEQYLNQTAIYYCHKRKLNEAYQEQIKSVIKKRYGLTIDNAQQRFIYNIDGGKHSLHTQRKMRPIISNIINEYLSVLESIVSFKST